MSLFKETCQTCRRVYECKTYARRGEGKCPQYTPRFHDMEDKK
jgi:hypothetical protein